MKKPLTCFFVSDLHGSYARYQKLFEEIRKDLPQAVFIGGDILPGAHHIFTASEKEGNNFIEHFLQKKFAELKAEIKEAYPRIFIILGNDDSRSEEKYVVNTHKLGIWEYIHNKKSKFKDYSIYGYSFIPPSPFLLKDWEKYDVSRYVDPGSVSPEEGFRSVNVPRNEIKHSTISEDLKLLVGNEDLRRAIFLFHAPPYKTKLDRAALDDKKIDHVPLDVHVGSVAIQRFIEERQPLLTLHGHIHESARITKSWKDRIGNTRLFSAAYDGPELALVRFDLEDLNKATRQLL
ncbi:MAG: metallophosphoesterase [Candidatus Aminicenantes bacterium]|jgi:Icc-related predicted phosphoesterase